MRLNLDDCNLPLVLDAKNLCEILGLSKSSVYLLMQRDNFPSIKVGKKGLRVPRDRFLEWLNNESEINNEKELKANEHIRVD